jgi:aldose 1-epimerase
MKITRLDKKGQCDGYLLENDQGMVVNIGLMGAAIRQLAVPAKEESLDGNNEGKQINLILGFAEESKYDGNPLYAGAAVGPVAGRIENSRMKIGEKTYELTANENGITCLHGGKDNVSFQRWEVTQAYATEEKAVLGLSLFLPDGLDGFPGNRHLSGVYELTNENQLIVRYDGVTDQATYLSMTNHSYFNLSGDFTKSGLEQLLTIPAGQYLRTDDRNIPVEFVSVEGTPYDFRQERKIKEQLDACPENREIQKARGLDNAFDIRQAAKKGEPVVTLRDAESGRTLIVKSPTSQCVVVYTGGFIEAGDRLLTGDETSPSCAVALECQAFPNGIHHPQWEPQITEPGKTYHHVIQYEICDSI